MSETDTETWTEWGVRRTWGDGSVARMDRPTAEYVARMWPGELVSRAVTAQPWRSEPTAEPEESETA